MSVYVAEYFGHRTDSPNAIAPVTSPTALCPFMKDTPCKKIAHDKKPPVCILRKNTQTQKDIPWIVCSKRLCASQHDAALTTYQKEMLLSIAKILFGGTVTNADICAKAEVPIKLMSPSAKDYRADYVLALLDPTKKATNGPDKLIVEMQGGGETSNTGPLTVHVNNWEAKKTHTNAELRLVFTKVGSIETNAWRRQQEQFLVKGSAAKATNSSYGIAFCVGQVLFDYIVNKIGRQQLASAKTQPNAAWTLAIIPVVEDPMGFKVGDSIPLLPDAGKTLFLDYNQFVNLLITQGGYSIEAFTGHFTDLNGKKVKL